MRGKYGRLAAVILAVAILTVSLFGCGQTGAFSAAESSGYTEFLPMENVQAETVTLAAEPAIPADLLPVASGTLVKKNEKAAVDYSNTPDGYVMVRYTASTQKKLKAQVKGPSGVTYTYNLKAGASDWTTFPLSDGSGGYKVTVYENISGTKYSTVLSVSFTAELTDEFAPFIRPNQYVNYAGAAATVAKAAELCSGMTDPLDKVKAVYNFVINHLTYDKQKAATVQSGYLPDLDAVLAAKTGICFDYAALMTGMLRSEGVPCKLVVGYAGTAYHAWISVYSDETGWIDGVVYFDGNTWQRMDPTFASSGKQSSAILSYIGDGSNYTAKYLY